MKLVIDILICELIVFSIIIFMMIYISLIGKDEEDEETEIKEAKNSIYLTLQNMTTEEILQFKNKNDFIKTIKDYDMIKYFLKGTEEENNNKLINWYYPEYRKL